jgi:2-oxoglutarate ferredoxin oxidoreductase subunit alpha
MSSTDTMDMPLSIQPSVNRQLKSVVVVHFAGDSGDGMQLIGHQLTEASAILGNDIQTFSDFPAEIRAPAGTIPGVSGFQMCFANYDIHTPGDAYDTLVAMNPAALIASLSKVKPHGILIVDSDKFTLKECSKAKIDYNPLEGDKLEGYRVYPVPMTQLSLSAVEPAGLSRAQARKAKNFFALGVVYWLYDRPLQHTLSWLEQKFKNKPELLEANRLALKAGYNYAMTAELFTEHYRVQPAKLPAGVYRQITGNEALALGIVASGYQAQTPVFMAGYPITPASDVLHQLSKWRDYGVQAFQAEDEMAAIGAAIGAAYGGRLAVTCTSGPGLDLKGEMIGLAVMTELPLVIVDVQRAGPSTGMPTKTEQADLLLALYGRHGECPVPVLAPKTPSDCFAIMLEAFDFALSAMTPVIVLSDGYLANGAEPWRVPDLQDLPKPKCKFSPTDVPYQPYARDKDTLARQWAVPGMSGCMHRLGGLEKENITGNISYDPANHQLMTNIRRNKVQKLQEKMPSLEVTGDKQGDLLVIGWGGTFGSIQSAVLACQEEGLLISHVHLRHLWPLPKQLPALLKAFKQVVVAELNQGQLCRVLRSEYLVKAQSLSQVSGKPFSVTDLIEQFKAVLETEICVD